MTKTRGFPLAQFITGSSSDDRSWPVQPTTPAINDSGIVKMGQGGGAPFARDAATQDTGRVKFGDGGSLPFARYPAERAMKVKIGAGGGAPFARR